MYSRTKNHLRIYSQWPYFILLTLFAILLVRSFFSFCQTDESFYITLVHRLWLGEKLLIEEWHPVQFYAPILLPIYSLYKVFVPSGDGVILFFRIIYVTLSFIVSVYVYRFFIKVIRPIYALFIASVVMLYSRANISGMSYYNICFLCGVMIVCLYLDSKASILAGVLSAIMVLSNPYMAIVLVPAIMILFFSDKTHRKYIVISLATIVVSALLYIVFFLNDFSAQLESIKYVISDPQHQQNVLDKIGFVARQIYGLTFKGCYFYLAILFFILFLGFKRKKNLFKTLLVLWYIVTLVFMILSALQVKSSITASITIPMTVSAIPCLAAVKPENRANMWGLTIYLWGLVIALMFFFASNTMIDAMTVGFVISSIGSIICLCSVDDILRGSETHITFKGILITAIILCAVSCLSLQRVIGVYRDDNLYNINVQIKSGPARGLYTTRGHEEQYSELLSVIHDVYKENPSGRVLHYKWLPWAYIATDWNYGTSSGWNAYDSTLEKYYHIHPEKLPDLVFVYSPSVGAWGQSYYINYGEFDNPNQGTEEQLFLLEANNYKIIKTTELVTVYKLF